MKEGSNAEKTRNEVCNLLNLLGRQLSRVVETIEDLERTLHNEEYDEDND